MPHIRSADFFKNAPWLAGLLALLGAGVYLVQSWIYAHTQFSMLDEGSYLVKGYLFATGRYVPFQDFGPWTNHMPLSFLIPGWVQVIFGPGLRSGRFLSIALGALLLLGLWIAVRRLGGRWWAALAMWVLALNPAVIKMYSLAISQVLAAALLVWILALTLGPKRKTWQLVMGSLLAGLLALTRFNLAPALFFLVLYLFWEYGWRTAALSAAVGGFVLLLGHAALWPDILKIWAYWLPESLTPFLSSWRYPVGADPSWVSAISPRGRFNSFWWAVRYNFIPVLAVLAVWLLWRARTEWSERSSYRMAVFLSALYAFLFIIHASTTVGGEFCVYCLQGYLAFFDVVGLLLFVVAFSSWYGAISARRWYGIAVFILLFSAVMGYAAFDVIGDSLITPRLLRRILFYELPRFSGLRFQPGTVALWGLLENRLGLDYNQLFALLRDTLRYIVSALAGLFTGLLVLLTARLLQRVEALRPISFSGNLGALALLLLLFAGLLLSPTPVLGAGYQDFDCGGDVLASYEAAGAVLAAHIPSGASVYWDGGKSAVPLLYLPGREIFPAQVNGAYTFRLGGDPDGLVGYGFWSAPLKDQWLHEADYMLIEERVLDNYARYAQDWTEVAVTQPTVSCRNDAEIYIFQPLAKVAQ